MIEPSGNPNPFTALAGLTVPLVQAPIGSATSPELAAAVSRAGALGTLALSWTAPEQVAEVVRATRALTSRPFGVNLVLEWDQFERLEVCLREGVRVVSTFWGDPAAYVAPIHDAGAIHIHSVGSVAEAEAAARAGVDVIVAQGWEAGGHVRGEVSTLALVPAVVDAVDPVPVLAAGGIADRRAVRAAHALGAHGCWVGTRFLLAAEADTHTDYRDRLIAATADDTAHSQTFVDGWDAPHRTLLNSTLINWYAAGSPAAPGRPGEGDLIGHAPTGRPLHRYGDDIPTRHTTGEVEALAHYAGQGVGQASAVQPAASIVAELTADPGRVTSGLVVHLDGVEDVAVDLALPLRKVACSEPTQPDRRMGGPQHRNAVRLLHQMLRPGRQGRQTETPRLFLPHYQQR